MKLKYILSSYILLVLIMIVLFYKIKQLNVPQKRNLILGVIQNYSWEKIEPFFISLIKADFKLCDYVMFVNGLSDKTKEKLHYYGFKTIEIPNKYKRMTITLSRHILYDEYLSNNTNKYNMVLHVDVRDSFFQRDLFEIYKNNKKPFVGVSIENGTLTNKINSKWMKDIYGDNIYQIIQNEKIICGGALWGTADKFLEINRKIWEEIKMKLHKNSINDQSVTNYLIYYKNLFKDILIKSDINSGPVMTVGLINYKNLSFDSEGNLLNYNGEKPSIIHQYDRINSLVEKVHNK